MMGPLWRILILSLVLRGVFAAILPLGTDEAYALAVGRSFSLSFFDHPPLGFWAPAVAEWVFGTNEPFLLRLPSLILGTIAIWGFYLCGRALGGEKVGLWAAILAALAPMLVFSGLMILPDAPLYPALIFTLYALIRLAQGDQDRGDQDLRWWALGGVSLAIALASKYQAGLVPVALLVWMLTSQIGRVWFVRSGFYLALGLSCLGLLPVLVWNMGHDWASFAFHTGRAGGGFAPLNFALMALGQMIYLLPPILVWAVILVADPNLWRDPVRRMVMILALGPIVLFNAIYLNSQNTLAHWTMAGWIMILPLVAEQITAKARGWLIGFALPIYGAALIVALQLAFGFLPIQTPPLIPMRATDQAVRDSGILAGADFIAAKDWIEAGHIAAALGPNPPMRVLSDPHHFAYMPAPKGRGVFLTIATGDHSASEALALVQTYDPMATALPPIQIGGRFTLDLVQINLP
jgi:4-amino-4-deoxy-L-arabinose transferase-like glycosyltransferase